MWFTDALRQAIQPYPLGPLGRGSTEVATTLVCSDVVGFTEMIERLGDRDALRVMQRHDEIVRRLTSAFGGMPLELRGDCFLLAFPVALRGLLCSIAIQRAFAIDRIRHPGEELEVRMGVHAGHVIRNGERYFGRNVIVVFRLTDEARSGEILATDGVRALVSHRSAVPIDEGRDLMLKGFLDPVRVFGVGWTQSASLPASECSERIAGESSALSACSVCSPSSRG